MELIPLLSLLLLLLRCFSVTALPRSRDTTAAPSELATCLLTAGVRNVSVASPNDTSSDFYRLLNFSIQNLRFARAAVHKPVAVVLPASMNELRVAVLCCRRADVAIRIRSGGHSYEGLSYVAGQQTRFAVIDLMKLNRVHVDVAARTAWVEAGATLGETYHAIATASGGEFGFSAGSCPTVGSGGHIAGGGFGLLSRKYGLAADNVVDAVLINAEGQVLDRSRMRDDVFWAIRGGGGGSWGALYAWKIRLLPVPRLVTSFIVERPGSVEQVAALVHRWQVVGPNLTEDFYLSVFVGSGLSGVEAKFNGFYLGPASEAVAILDREFPELGVSTVDCNETSWIDSVVRFSGLKDGATAADLTDRTLQPKSYFKAKSDYVRAPIPEHELAVAFGALAGEPKANVILDPYGGAMQRTGSDSLPFPHRGGNLYSIQYGIEWGEGEEDGKYVEWMRGFYGSMGRHVSAGPRAAYVNYLDLDLGVSGSKPADPVAEARAWGARYFLGNFDRLVRAKTAVDPHNVFSNPQSIPPMPKTDDDREAA